MAWVPAAVKIITAVVAASSTAYSAYSAKRARDAGPKILQPPALPTDADVKDKKAEARQRALGRYGQEKMKLTPSLGPGEATIEKKKLLGG